MKALAIANPVGGSFDKEKFEESIKIIEKKIGSVEIVYTKHQGHATEIAKKTDAYIIISAGGDGIINEVVNGIEGKECVFLPLPFGTANVFCKEHKIPMNPINAAKKINFETFSSVYLGKINNRYFIQMVGFGFDANVVKKVNLKIKKKFGKLAYILSGLKQLIINDTTEFEFYCKGRKIKAYNAIFSVGKLYAGNFYLSKIKKENNILICYHKNKSRISLLKTFFLMAFGLGFDKDTIEADTIKIIGPNYCQLDGDLYYLKNMTNYIKIKKSSFVLAK